MVVVFKTGFTDFVGFMGCFIAVVIGSLVDILVVVAVVFVVGIDYFSYTIDFAINHIDFI